MAPMKTMKAMKSVKKKDEDNEGKAMAPMKSTKADKKPMKTLKKPSGSGTGDNWWTKAVKPQKASGLTDQFDGEQCEGLDAPDGEPDLRATSRAQREVWKRNKHLASEADALRFEFLKSTACTEKGKQFEANRIINAYIPRNADYRLQKLEPKKLTLDRIHSTTDEDKSGVVVTGMKMNTFIGSCFSGNKQLFDLAKDEGEIYEDEDGLWYKWEKRSSKMIIKRQEDRHTEKVDFGGDKAAFLTNMCSNMNEEKSLNKWVVVLAKKFAGGSFKGSKKRALRDGKEVTDDTMIILQES